MKLICAIDLLWVRPEQVGGIESYIRNLLDGFCNLTDDFEMWLLVSIDNGDTFSQYEKDKRFHICVCNIESKNVFKRILWQNFNLGKIVRTLGVSKCFEPYYCKPVMGCKGIDFYTTIHDLQALHYPKYFSKAKVLWMKLSWRNSVKTSKKVVTISEYVREDILANYKVDEKKIVTIYNPIVIKKDEMESEEYIEKKYNVKRFEYYFTVSSLLPHKNIYTLIKVFAEIKSKQIDLPCKLIVSGVGGKSREQLEKLINEYKLRDNILLTGYIKNSERNSLYKYSKAFLFPSIFEGFGMPPVEAMYLNVPVITTRRTSLEEVTQGKANYVNDPYNIYDWIHEMKECTARSCDFSIYEKEVIAKGYMKIFGD